MSTQKWKIHFNLQISFYVLIKFFHSNSLITASHIQIFTFVLILQSQLQVQRIDLNRLVYPSREEIFLFFCLLIRHKHLCKVLIVICPFKKGVCQTNPSNCLENEIKLTIQHPFTSSFLQRLRFQSIFVHINTTNL